MLSGQCDSLGGRKAHIERDADFVEPTAERFLVWRKIFAGLLKLDPESLFVDAYNEVRAPEISRAPLMGGVPDERILVEQAPVSELALLVAF
jgi:hypothetical protein